MAIGHASKCTKGTTPAMNTKTDENAASLSDPESTLCSEPETLTPCLFGENTLTTPSQNRKASSALSSEMKRQTATYRPSLSDRLTPSLISAGLVKGIIPKSVRKQLGARIRDTVFSLLDGAAPEEPKTDCSYLNDRSSPPDGNLRSPPDIQGSGAPAESNAPLTRCERGP